MTASSGSLHSLTGQRTGVTPTTAARAEQTYSASRLVGPAASTVPPTERVGGRHASGNDLSPEKIAARDLDPVQVGWPSHFLAKGLGRRSTGIAYRQFR